MTTKAAIYNQWCIVTGVDFRKNLRRTDKSLPKIDNPNFNPDCPVSISNPRQITAPKDLTGYGAIMDIRAAEDYTSALLVTISDGLGITIGSPDPADGTIELFIDNTVTGAAPFTNYINQDVYFNLVLIPPASGDLQPILRGRIKVLDSITDLTGV
jgi:hypothetical protein